MSSELTLTAAGDAMITARMRSFDHLRFDGLPDLIRSADLAPVYLVVLLHDYEEYPATKGPGTYMRAPRWVANELTRIGFDMFAVATNYALDYTQGGMGATMRSLDARDFPK